MSTKTATYPNLEAKVPKKTKKAAKKAMKAVNEFTAEKFKQRVVELEGQLAEQRTHFRTIEVNLRDELRVITALRDHADADVKCLRELCQNEIRRTEDARNQAMYACQIIACVRYMAKHDISPTDFCRVVLGTRPADELAEDNDCDCGEE
jgi:hypothetical protein